MMAEEATRSSSGSPVGDARREQSTIAFPYLDLDAAVDVARAIYRRSGLSGCDLDELAAEMNQVISGAFRLKTGAARVFDLIEKDGRSGVKLSELGRQIVSEETERAARAEAFMRVPLYAAIYEMYKGHLLPPMKALEREMQTLGVSSKQTDKARQAFERSARQAGFFERGEDRLVRPRADLPTLKVQDENAERDDDPKELAKRRASVNREGSLPKSASEMLLELLDPGAMTEEEQKAVWTLILYAKRPKETAADR